MVPLVQHIFSFMIQQETTAVRIAVWNTDIWSAEVEDYEFHAYTTAETV